jgi:hypothetical protein
MGYFIFKFFDDYGTSKESYLLALPKSFKIQNIIIESSFARDA